MKRAENDNSESIRKVNELIKDIRIAMLTTVDEEGVVRSRPMATQQAEFNGDLWFFTKSDTAKVEDVERYQQVNVSYSEPSDNKYVSVMGSAEIIDDRAKMKELWNPLYKAWFPDGLDDPQIRLLKVEVEEVEYWDSPGGKVASVLGFVKSLVSGKQADMGENETVKIADAQTSAKR